jgi:hypothetical protein
MLGGSMKDKQYILNEIRRIAERNGGKPVGVDRFRTETGIAEHEWCGVYWARWSDALAEAGFEPLKWTVGLSEEETLDVMAKLVRQYSRYPTKSEILIEKRNNPAIPTPKAVARKIGGKAEAIKKVRAYCTLREGYADVAAILAQEVIATEPENGTSESKSETGKLRPSGYVYLVKSGKLYKIGFSENHWRRKGELHKQTSEGITEIHTIAAIDDAPGIEKYWHERFKEKRQHGEWFDLSADDISAFKRRKFM